MQNLTAVTIDAVKARIYTLPGRPQFMTVYDLAEFYQRPPKQIMQQVRRNAGRFPPDFIFEMSEAETQAMLPHFEATSQGRRTDLKHYGFTEQGAMQLSSVLTGPVADEVSVIIIRTFLAIRKALREQTQFMLTKLSAKVVARTPIYVIVREGALAGYSFDAICMMGNYSKPKMAVAMHECLASGLIEKLPRGTPAMQADLFAPEG